MHNKVKQLKEPIDMLYSTHHRLVYLTNFRVQYMKDPVTALGNIRIPSTYTSAIPTLEATIARYTEIFESPANIELAKEDFLVILNDSILTTTEDLVTAENAVSAALNEVIKTNNLVGASLTDPNNLLAMLSVIAKASKSLPQAELFEKRLSQHVNEIMSRTGVNSPNYISWLYGIAKELEEDNIEEILTTSEYNKLERYIQINDTNLMANIDKLTDVRLDAGISDLQATGSPIANYSVTPGFKVSGLTIVKAIVTYLGATIDVLSSKSHEYVFDNFDKAKVLKTTAEQELSDITANFIELPKLLEAYPTFIKNVSLVVTEVTDRECLVAIELRKYLAIQAVLVEAIVNA